MDKDAKRLYRSALVAGASAGLTVDMALFPLDTIKTRLQSAEGFAKSGGFRGVYSGVLSSAIGSVPTAAVFFVTYEMFKKVAGDTTRAHAVGASLGEVAACVVRVPVEVVKQRAQASRTSSAQNFLMTLRTEGVRGFYRGFWSTVWRDVPFSLIEIPLWEALKKYAGRGSENGEVSARASAVCGAVAGATAAAMTNPLDVAKTRIILADQSSALSRGSILEALRSVHREKGWAGMSAGVVPRMAWMSVGGFLFLGMYDLVKGWAYEHHFL